MSSVQIGPDGGYMTAFCRFCGFASQVREESPSREHRHAAMDAACELNSEHEKSHPEWTEPKDFLEAIEEMHAEERARHSAHGCTPEPCCCRCGCTSTAGCTVEPEKLCIMCAHRAWNRDDEEHGEPLDATVTDARTRIKALAAELGVAVSFGS